MLKSTFASDQSLQEDGKSKLKHHEALNESSLKFTKVCLIDALFEEALQRIRAAVSPNQSTREQGSHLFGEQRE